jgi:hypothetical protein
LYIGDGTNSVDIIFEQSGKVRALTNKTLTLGQSDSYVTTASPFGFLSPDGTKQITARMLNTDVLSFQGNAGELLSLSDSFSGTIFSVNDVSGIPSIEVLDTGVVKLAQYSGNVGIGDAAPAQKLSVTGNIAATGQLTSTVATGTAPLTVASTTLVSNLNADLLDGLHSATANTVSTVVARDASGNFSAGTITAALTGNASGSAATFTSTTQNSQFNSIGVGVAASANAGQINASNVIASGYVTGYGGVGQLQAVSGSVSSWYNSFLRNDGVNVYLLSSAVQTTQALATNASFNAYRPFSWALTTGAVTIDGTGIGTSFGGTITGTRLISNIATGTAPLTVASTTLVTNLNADLLDGLHLHTGTNNEVNKIVRTDVSGYIQAGWISTISGDNGTTVPTRIYASSDGFIRYYTPTNFRTVLNVPTRTGGDASGTWGIAITGNAATATSATNLYGAGGSYIASSSAASTSYGSAIQVREIGLGGVQASAMAAAPRLAFHWSGVVASSIAIEPGGRIGIFNNPGTSYEAFVCAGLQCNQVSSQAPDGDYVVRSYNTSASGASQFYVKHNLSNVEVGNDRGAISFLGNASTATTLATARNINGTSFNGSADITVTAAAGTLTGATLASGVTASSLTSVGTLTSLSATGNITGSAFIPSGSSVPSNGMYLSAANTLNWSTATTLRMTLSSAGALTVVGEITAFSDSSLKANIEIIADALNKVEAIRGVTYTRTDSDDKQKRHTGVIAQEIEAVLPEAVLVNEDGIRSVAYGNMVGLLIEAVKELSSQNKALLARLEVLEAKE